MEQEDVERIARKALKELGVPVSTLTVARAGTPDAWRIEFGGRAIKIRCGRGTTPQWVREQIFDQVNASR